MRIKELLAIKFSACACGKEWACESFWPVWLADHTIFGPSAGRLKNKDWLEELITSRSSISLTLFGFWQLGILRTRWVWKLSKVSSCTHTHALCFWFELGDDQQVGLIGQ